MTRNSHARSCPFLKLLAGAVLLLAPMTAALHEHEVKVPDPGFRPDSEHSAVFLEALDTATIAVYPSIVRRNNRTAHSFASQEQIIALLNEKGIGAAIEGKRRIDLGALPRASQWELFQNSMWRIAEELQDRPPDADYRLVVEFLFPVSNQAVFGIECYILDRNGKNAFSFLLNSHHQLFVDTRLVAAGTSEAARAALLKRATQLAVIALEQQIRGARKVTAAPASAGVAPNVASSPANAVATGSDEWSFENGDPCTDAVKGSYPINELPMYGHMKKTAAQKRADKNYIEFMTEDGRSRASAADAAAANGWHSYYAGDCCRAIRRFNQAWLLDPENQLALWGFGAICMSRSQPGEALRYLRMAIDNGPEHAKLRQDYNYVLKREL